MIFPYCKLHIVYKINKDFQQTNNNKPKQGLTSHPHMTSSTMRLNIWHIEDNIPSPTAVI